MRLSCLVLMCFLVIPVESLQAQVQEIPEGIFINLYSALDSTAVPVVAVKPSNISMGIPIDAYRRVTDEKHKKLDAMLRVTGDAALLSGIALEIAWTESFHANHLWRKSSLSNKVFVYGAITETSLHLPILVHKWLHESGCTFKPDKVADWSSCKNDKLEDLALGLFVTATYIQRISQSMK